MASHAQRDRAVSAHNSRQPSSQYFGRWNLPRGNVGLGLRGFVVAMASCQSWGLEVELAIIARLDGGGMGPVQRGRRNCQSSHRPNSSCSSHCRKPFGLGCRISDLWCSPDCHWDSNPTAGTTASVKSSGDGGVSPDKQTALPGGRGRQAPELATGYRPSHRVTTPNYLALFFLVVPFLRTLSALRLMRSNSSLVRLPVLRCFLESCLALMAWPLSGIG